MDINALNADLEKQTASAKAAYAALMDHISKTLSGWVAKSSLTNAYVDANSHSHAQVGVKMKDENGKIHTCDFDLHFDKIWPEKTYELKVNFGCFGSFTKDDTLQVEYCQLLGFITSHMKEIEHELLFTPQAKALFEASDKASNILWKLSEQKRAYESEVQRAKDEARRNEIAAKLIAGAKLRIGKNWRGEPVYDTIERVTPKLIFLKSSYGTSTKKEKAISYIVASKWEFAD